MWRPKSDRPLVHYRCCEHCLPTDYHAQLVPHDIPCAGDSGCEGTLPA